MHKYRTYYIGTEDEVAHHAQPLVDKLDVRIIEPHLAPARICVGDLAIFFSEHFDRFRDAWYQLNEKGCNTLYAIDGILEWRNAWEQREDEPACPWTMRPVLSDKVACIGASQARILDSWGNQGKTEIVGLPRLDHFAVPSQQAKSPSEFRLLVATAKWPGFDAKQTEQIKQSLLDLKSYFERTPSINGRTIDVCWRLTKDMDTSVGVKNQLRDTSGKDLAEVLQNVDAVITTPSTVLLESMICDLPTCIVDYTNSPRYVDAAWSITSQQHMDSVIRELADPSPKRMLFQNTILNDTLHRESPAAERFVKLVNEMIRTSHDCREKNAPVVFPTNILPPPTTAPQLDLPDLYPNRPEFTAPDSKSQLSAHLAESRRKIEHLEERIDVVESALNAAIGELEKVHKHRLLGPILKAGEKIISIRDSVLHNKSKDINGSKKSRSTETT